MLRRSILILKDEYPGKGKTGNGGERVAKGKVSKFLKRNQFHHVASHATRKASMSVPPGQRRLAPCQAGKKQQSDTYKRRLSCSHAQFLICSPVSLGLKCRCCPAAAGIDYWLTEKPELRRMPADLIPGSGSVFGWVPIRFPRHRHVVMIWIWDVGRMVEWEWNGNGGGKLRQEWSWIEDGEEWGMMVRMGEIGGWDTNKQLTGVGWLDCPGLVSMWVLDHIHIEMPASQVAGGKMPQNCKN